MTLQPATVDELQAIVRDQKKLVLRGGGTKSALSTAPDGAVTLDMGALNGILEYQPDEYTFTAYAGTPLKTIVAALAEHGQYLPFDPLLVENGATLGGTVAANTSGSGRWRYGGVRDFILGIRFVDGRGRYVRSGGKVVKNAAGFDLPKFFVGSLGDFGALVEMSFKVFPQPARFVTLQVTCASVADAMQAIFAIMPSPLETDAIDLETYHEQPELYFRLGGLSGALPGRIERLKTFLHQHAPIKSAETLEDEGAFWRSVSHLEWAGASTVVKVPVAPRQVVDLEAKLHGIPGKRRYSAAGNVAWIALDDVAALAPILRDMGLTGLQLRGDGNQQYVGAPLKGIEMLRRVKDVLDPERVFRGDY
jgi:glycolate oxidase FAD binding subunit